MIEPTKEDWAVFRRLQPITRTVGRVSKFTAFNPLVHMWFVVFDGKRAFACDGRKVVVIKHESQPMAICGNRKDKKLVKEHGLGFGEVRRIRTEGREVALLDAASEPFAIYPSIWNVIPDPTSLHKKQLQGLKESMDNLKTEVDLKDPEARTLLKLDGIEVLLNANYLMDILKAFRGKQVAVQGTDNVSPVRLDCNGDLGVLMPIRP